MSDRGESEGTLAAAPVPTAAPRPTPTTPAARVVCCRLVAAADGGRSDSVGAPRASEFGDESRRSVGGG